MKYLYRLAAFTFFFSFVFGFVWSVYLKKPDHITHTHTLTLLVPESLEVLGFSKSLTTHSEVQIIPLVYKSFEQLESLLEKQQAEAVILPSATASRLIETKLIPELPEELLQLFSFIHVDFKSLGYDPDNSFTFPLFWGVNGLASAEDGSETVRVSRIDDFVQKHFFEQKQKGKKSDPPALHDLTRKSLQTVKASHNLVQLPASFFPMFETLPTEDKKQWTFSIPEEEGDLWVLSLGLLNPEASEKVEALVEFLFGKTFESTFLQANPLGVTYLTLQKLPDNQHPKFLRTLPLKRIQIRDISVSSLRDSSEDGNQEKIDP